MDLESVISVKDVYKSYGNVHALQGVSLEVPKGTVLGLLGPNGAGKTTLVRVLTTLLKPDSGIVTVSGIDVAAHPDQVRNYIGLAGQYAAIDETLTGKENLYLVGKLYHLPQKDIVERATSLLERFSLTDAADRPTKTYSGGMRRRLDLAASLMGDPEVLFLDEPTTGLDPRSRIELWEVIEELVKSGTTLLLTTQYLEEADYLADNIVVIDRGTVIAQGTAMELKSQIGGSVIELHLANKSQAESVITMLKQVGITGTQEEGTHHITIATDTGAKTLLEVMRVTDQNNIELIDLELRKPSLDEVFLKLTGQKSGGNNE